MNPYSKIINPRCKLVNITAQSFFQKSRAKKSLKITKLPKDAKHSCIRNALKQFVPKNKYRLTYTAGDDSAVLDLINDDNNKIAKKVMKQNKTHENVCWNMQLPQEK